LFAGRGGRGAGSRPHDESATREFAENETLDGDQVSFVMCLEANRLEPQGLLLCESIRTFGGRYAKSPIFGVSPRPDLALGPAACARLRELDVTYVIEPLNLTGHPYNTINRIVTGGWAEVNVPASHLIMLDTDTVFTAEPKFKRTDAGVRPVDMKGSASNGTEDALDAYWSHICSLAGIALDDLPMLHTTVGNDRIRACYNGGFTVVRRSLGILQQTREVFFQSLAQDLRPFAGRVMNIRASTGWVGTAASEWWGSSQSALSAAIWSKTRDVQVYGPDYNIPVHLLADDTRCWSRERDFAPILLHYHYLGDSQHRDDLSRVLRKIGCSQQALAWVFAKLSLFD
jgi:hypothetical protein